MTGRKIISRYSALATLLLFTSLSLLPVLLQQPATAQFGTQQPPNGGGIGGDEASNFGTQQPPNGGVLQQYENPTYGFKISYPNNWNKQDLNVTKGKIIGFFSPDTRSEVRVMIQKLQDPNASVDDFTNAFASNFAIHTQVRSTTLSGLPARWFLVAQSTSGQSPPAIISTFATVKEGYVYAIQYIVPDQSQFSAYTNTVIQMLQSFEITKSLQGSQSSGPGTTNLPRLGSQSSGPGTTNLPRLGSQSSGPGTTNLPRLGSQQPSALSPGGIVPGGIASHFLTRDSTTGQQPQTNQTSEHHHHKGSNLGGSTSNGNSTGH